MRVDDNMSWGRPAASDLGCFDHINKIAERVFVKMLENQVYAFARFATAVAVRCMKAWIFAAALVLALALGEKEMGEARNNIEEYKELVDTYTR